MVIAQAACSPAFRIADAAVIFDAVEAHRRRRQAEFAKDAGAEAALEGEVVHGHHRRRRRGLAVAHVGERQRRLPVMRMHHVRHVAGDRAGRDVRAGEAQRGEAPPVVGPVGAGGVAVWSARPVEEMRRIEHQKVEAGRLGRQDRDLAAMQRRIAMQWRGLPCCLQHLREARDQRPRRHALPGERDRQGAGHVGQPACLDQGKNLGRDRENLHQKSLPCMPIPQVPSLSIISWVIRQMPFSETRNRLASLTGSSPTTSPSGMRTP